MKHLVLELLSKKELEKSPKNGFTSFVNKSIVEIFLIFT